MTTQKWNLVPVDCWRELEPYLGKDVPNREVVLLSDVKGALAAPQPTRLSDERIYQVWGEQAEKTIGKSHSEFLVSFVRAIEREIFGGEQA